MKRALSVDTATAINLTKFLCNRGVAARRKCAELIKQGRVSVNGIVVMTPGCRVTIDDQIRVDGAPVAVPSLVYLMLNKPRGYVCTNKDKHASLKAIDLIKTTIGSTRVFSVGRLDKDSEGLLLFTNDGGYAEQLMHPRHEVLKTYVVETDCDIAEPMLQDLRNGITDDGDFLKPRSLVRVGPCLYKFVLNEGKKREIRRLIRYTGSRVLSLKRIAIGNLHLDNLESGKFRFMSKQDVAASLS